MDYPSIPTWRIIIAYLEPDDAEWVQYALVADKSATVGVVSCRVVHYAALNNLNVQDVLDRIPTDRMTPDIYQSLFVGYYNYVFSNYSRLHPDEIAAFDKKFVELFPMQTDSILTRFASDAVRSEHMEYVRMCLRACPNRIDYELVVRASVQTHSMPMIEWIIRNALPIPHAPGQSGPDVLGLIRSTNWNVCPESVHELQKRIADCPTPIEQIYATTIALFEAVTRDYQYAVCRLRAMPNFADYTLLAIYAAKAGDLEMIQLLGTTHVLNYLSIANISGIYGQLECMRYCLDRTDELRFIRHFYTLASSASAECYHELVKLPITARVPADVIARVIVYHFEQLQVVGREIWRYVDGTVVLRDLLNRPDMLDACIECVRHTRIDWSAVVDSVSSGDPENGWKRIYACLRYDRHESAYFPDGHSVDDLRTKARLHAPTIDWDAALRLAIRDDNPAQALHAIAYGADTKDAPRTALQYYSYRVYLTVLDYTLTDSLYDAKCADADRQSRFLEQFESYTSDTEYKVKDDRTSILYWDLRSGVVEPSRSTVAQWAKACREIRELRSDALDDM